MNKSFYGKCFFLTCSLNSVDVDFVVNGDDDVGDNDDDEQLHCTALHIFPPWWDDGDDEGEDEVDQDCVVFPLISRSPPGTWQTRG